MKKELSNPFVIEGYAGKKYFCDREQETINLTRFLENGSNVTLYSPRKMGKTGLIWHVFKQSLKVHCYYLDIMDTWCLKDFIDKFASVIIGSLDSKIEVFMQNAFKVFGHLRPTFSYDALTGSPKINLDISENQENQTLESIFEYIRKKGETCYIAIDEFQKIRDYPEKGVEALLRSQIQFTHNARFIFSGSSRHLMADMFVNPQKPFYESTSPMHLDRIDRAKYYKFASGFFKKSGRTLSEELFNYVYDEVSGHTWYVQKWMNTLYSHSEEDITKEEVLAALREILLGQQDFFYAVLQGLTSNERRVLTAIAKEGKLSQPRSTEFMNKYDLPAPSSIVASIKRLVDKEIIYEYNGEYSVYNRFLGIWLRG